MEWKNFLTALLPFNKNAPPVEYYFALNITPKKLQASLWTVEGDSLKVLNPQTIDYSSAELIAATDKLLDLYLGDSLLTPEKVLFGVPDGWLLDDDLKEPYLKLLRNLVKELELEPMAYVAASHALTHFLELKEGAPATAILIGIDEMDVTVTVSRAGRVDGTKVLERSDNLGEDIEKALLMFTEVEVLPSRLLLYSLDKKDLEKQKTNLLSFPWMDKLSFLHFPKIDLLEKDIAIRAVALAGASEINPQVQFQSPLPEEDQSEGRQEKLVKEPKELEKEVTKADNFGFVAGDITKMERKVEPKLPVPNLELMSPQMSQDKEDVLEKVNFRSSILSKLSSFNLLFLSGKNKIFALPLSVLFILILAYLFFARAEVTIFVEPRILERDSQVTADPTAKKVDEGSKIIPGQVVETQVSGFDKAPATGKKQIGDASKGTVVIYNKTYDSKTFSKGNLLTSSGGLKFTIDQTVSVASQSATEGGITFGKVNAPVAATAVGADYNLPSGTEFTIASLAASQFSAKAEGNFSGGTSKEVTVVTDSDQKKLLAQVAATLRKQAAEKLQSELKDKKILEEALLEEITSKSYSKGINDQASEFSLKLTVKYKGTAYKEEDLKLIVSKLLETNVPEDFELNLAQTETLADVSKLEKDGRLIFLARFKAKLTPKLDQEQIKQKIKGQNPANAANILKTYENILGSEIKITPYLPAQLSRLPFLASNIKLEVKLK